MKTLWDCGLFGRAILAILLAVTIVLLGWWVLDPPSGWLPGMFGVGAIAGGLLLLDEEAER
jgi:hypothetical protein